MLKKIFFSFFMLFIPSLCFADGVGTVGLTNIPARSGEAIYKTICQSCHMGDAMGATGVARYPALAQDPNLASTAFTATTVLYGRKAMPAFGGLLDDEQVANIVNYVRQNFGNHYEDVVTPDEIQALRKPNYQYPSMD